MNQPESWAGLVQPQELRLAASIFAEHLADAAEVMDRQVDADRRRPRQHQDVLDNRVPGRGVDPGDHDVHGQHDAAEIQMAAPREMLP